MAVNGKQELVGGVILPGPQLSLSALVQKTAQLPQIDLSAPASSSILGKNTSACLQNGFVLGTAGLLDGLAERFQAELGPDIAFMPPATCPAPSGGLPHADRIPGVSDHGRTLPHLAEKSERVISKSKGVLHHEFQTCISALLSNLLVSFSGCTKVTQLVKDAQPTKAELLAEINEEHRRYEGGSSDPTPYLRHYDDPADAQKSTDYLTDTYSEYDAAKELNPEEAEEDVNYLFDAFYYDFAFYDYFGGHAVFDQAKLILCRKSKAGTA